MPYQTVGDMLKRSEDFHGQLSDFYTRLGASAEEPRVKLLLEHMGRHEKRLGQWLVEYEQAAPGALLDTWCQFTPERATCKCFEGIDLQPDMSMDDVVAVAQRLDGCLLALYRELAEAAATEEARDLFESLLEMEQREDVEYAREALEI